MLWGAGCGHTQPKPAKPAATPPPNGQLIVTPAQILKGKVVSVNHNGKFVVLNFPLGQLPPAGQLMSLYRGGLKVGEVRVTPTQYENNIIADIVTGEANAEDEARGE